MSRRLRQRTPSFVSVPSTLAIVFLGVPLLALLLAVPWSNLGALLATAQVREALGLSLITATCATIIAVVLGVPLAWLLAHSTGHVARWSRPLVLLPLVLPPVVGAVTLLMAFGRRGLIGGPLYDAFGVQLPFTTAGVVVAEAFVAMPFLVITVEGALRSQDRTLVDAARSLGASPWTVMRRVTMPLIVPSLVAGIALCWARALGEFGATITFAGNFPGVTQTIPLAVYSALEVDREQALALSMVLLGVCVVVMVSLRRHLVAGISR